MKKVCVYTALVGAYDIGIPTLKNTLPEYFEFHCFTDQKRLTSDLWNMHYISDIPVHGDVSKSAYYYKWKAHELFGNEYDVVIWMDASAYDINLENIRAEVEKFKTLGTSIHIEEHPSRSKSLIQECDINCHLKKDDVDVMRSQVNRYYKEGYKDSFNILVPETGFSIRKFRDPRCILISDKIIDEMTGTDRTKRDQLVWNYAVWKTGTKDSISMFSFQHKMENLVKFKDHPHREKHLEKVLLVGPWLGEDHIEQAWIQYAKEYLSNTPIDKVVVGCKKGREHLYDCLSPDRVVGVDAKGVVYKHLMDGSMPTFDIKVSGEKEIIRLSPTTDIISRIYKPSITLLWCTVRPKMMIDTYNHWLSTASSTDNINLVVGVDTEDDRSELIELGIDGENVVVVPPNPMGKRGVTWPSYYLSSNLVCKHNDDIVIFASDDFYSMQNWDVEVVKHLADFDGCLVVNDGLNANQHTIVAIPIMTYGCLVAHNKIIYHPAYGHAYSDQELYDNLKELGRLKDIAGSHPHVIFEHRHWTNSKNNRARDDHDMYQGTKHHEEKATYLRRQRFPLSKRLEVVVYKKKLSILVCSLTSRKDFLDELLWGLSPQIDACKDDVELIVDIDNGEVSIGEKRNRLLANATGEYIAFVDDDDIVSAEYVRLVLDAVKSNADCCSLNGVITIDGKNPCEFRHSLKYKEWSTERIDGKIVYNRCPNHLNAVNVELARMAGFRNDLSFQEDLDYSSRLRPLLGSEVAIDPVLYYYRGRTNKGDENV